MTMHTSLARGYAAHLINKMPCNDAMNASLDNGMLSRVYAQFIKSCSVKKPDLIGRKLHKAANGKMRVRLPHWSRNRTNAVLDCVVGVPDMPAYSFFAPDSIRWTESSLGLHTIFCERKFDDIDLFHLSGPTIGKHAIARLLQRGAATPESLLSVCKSALYRSRDAVALLTEEEQVYELLLPFAKGALAVQVHGARKATHWHSQKPCLSIRTYLPEAMLSPENCERILDLEDFYLQRAFSDTDRYRSLLQQNIRILHPAPSRQEESCTDLYARALASDVIHQPSPRTPSHIS